MLAAVRQFVCSMFNIYYTSAQLWTDHVTLVLIQSNHFLAQSLIRIRQFPLVSPSAWKAVVVLHVDTVQWRQVCALEMIMKRISVLFVQHWSLLGDAGESSHLAETMKWMKTVQQWGITFKQLTTNMIFSLHLHPAFKFQRNPQNKCASWRTCGMFGYSIWNTRTLTLSRYFIKNLQCAIAGLFSCSTLTVSS